MPVFTIYCKIYYTDCLFTERPEYYIIWIYLIIDDTPSTVCTHWHEHITMVTTNPGNPLEPPWASLETSWRYID